MCDRLWNKTVKMNAALMIVVVLHHLTNLNLIAIEKKTVFPEGVWDFWRLRSGSLLFLSVATVYLATWSFAHYLFLFSPPSPSFSAFLWHTLWSWKLTLNPKLRGSDSFKVRQSRDKDRHWVEGSKRPDKVGRGKGGKKCGEGTRKLNSEEEYYWREIESDMM